MTAVPHFLQEVRQQTQSVPKMIQRSTFQETGVIQEIGTQKTQNNTKGTVL